MSDCERYDEMLSASLDGELREEEQAELNAHLAVCEDCRAYLSALRAVSQALGEDLEAPPEKLAKGIQYKVELEASRRRFRFGSYGRWTAAAAVVCLALLGVVKLAPLGAPKGEQSGGAVLSAAGMNDAPAERDGGEGFGAASADSTGADSADNGAELEWEAGAEDSMTAIQNGSMADTDMEETATERSALFAPDMAAPESMPASEPAPAPSFSMKSGDMAAEDAPETELPSLAAGLQPGYEVYLGLEARKSYYAVMIVYGETPEEVTEEAGCQAREAPAGQLQWLVPLELMLELELNERFDELYFGDLMADTGLVVVLTEGY